jgi:hypothetical protein
VVGEGLLAVHAVARELDLHLVFEFAPRLLQPGAGGFPARPDRGPDIQAGQFADQVVVGRGMARQVARDRAAMGVDRFEPVGAQALALLAGEQAAAFAADQLPHQAPVDQADAQFQRAGPVGAGQRRALVEPAAQLVVQRVQPGHVAGHGPGLDQPHQVQVAVQFPHMLDVADLLAVGDADIAGKDGRADHAAVRIAVPDRRHADVEAAVGEQHDVAGADAVGIGQQPLALGIEQQRRSAHMEGPGPRQRRRGAPAHSFRHALGRRLLDAVADLGHRHAAQTIDQPDHSCRFAHHFVPANSR